MSDSISSGVAAPPVIDTSSIPSAPPSFWDRASRWASDNKAAVYTIAGVTVVVSAGAIYYYSSQPSPSSGPTAERKQARKDKKKAKKEAEKSERSSPPPEKQAEEGTAAQLSHYL